MLSPLPGLEVDPGTLEQVLQLASYPPAPDLELLQAITHEICTPLTTIRVLTRSLLKRQDLGPEVIQRLQEIERECTEQIDRFGLIFRATELQSSPRALNLTLVSLEDILDQSVPRWKVQTRRRDLVLEVETSRLPAVHLLTDPVMLDQALLGLIDRCSRHLPRGGKVCVQVGVVGDRIKVQVWTRTPPEQHWPSDPRALGQILVWHPATGSLNLSLTVTKSLFQALGGKLVVRQRPQEPEVMTVFLPCQGAP